MDRPIVNVREGQLQGIQVENVLGGNYFAFRGIPFAAPPIGELRFKDPRPPASWSGIRDASKVAGEMCTQVDEYSKTNSIIGGEDCLYLSVYTASLTEKKAVIVWIHGGAYLTGSERFYRPDYLITRDLVIVCISYRLGALGFLNLDHEDASGNQGMKDQVMALKWVKENIANFGGDPNNITICGASAGASSAHLLAMSPMCNGLFHKVIMQSGTGTSFWATMHNIPERSFKLAQLLGKDSKDPKEVLEFLRGVPAVDIVQNQFRVLGPEEIIHMPFGPCIDTAAKEPFLPQSTQELAINDSNMPIMVGHSAYEFLMFMKDTSEEYLREVDERFPRYIELLNITSDKDKLEQLTKEVRDCYFRNKSFTKDHIPAVITFLTDIYFTCGHQKLVDDRRKRSQCEPTYFFKFSYVGDEITFTKALLEEPPMIGASHVDELSYLFYLDILKKGKNAAPPATGTKDRIMLERMTRMWTNFAKTGNPTPSMDEYITTTWRPATKESFCYLEIDNESTIGTVQNDLYRICQKYS